MGIGVRGRKPQDRRSEDQVKRLQIASVEGVALVQIAGLVTLAKPADPLLGRTMGEGIRDDITLRAFLQTIVANGTRGTNRFVYVAGLNDVLRAIREMRPDTGEEIRL